MKTLKFACSDYTFPLLAHPKVLSLIALLDCKGVDIGLFSGRSHLRPETELQQPGKRAKLLKTQLEDSWTGCDRCLFAIKYRLFYTCH